MSTSHLLPLRGRVVQVNISAGGLPKRAIREAMLGPLGLEGDSVAHPGIHGGPQKAVLLITAEGIEELKAMGYPLFHGAMGENLTTLGLDRRLMRLGQRYRVGAAVIELTTVRRPCDSLDVYGPGLKDEIYDAAVRAGDPASPRWGLSGFYARVVEPGVVRAEDIIWVSDQVV